MNKISYNEIVKISSIGNSSTEKSQLDPTTYLIYKKRKIDNLTSNFSVGCKPITLGSEIVLDRIGQLLFRAISTLVLQIYCMLACSKCK